MNPKPQSDEWFELLEQTSPIDMLASWSESEPTISQKAMVEEPMNVKNVFWRH